MEDMHAERSTEFEMGTRTPLEHLCYIVAQNSKEFIAQHLDDGMVTTGCFSQAYSGAENRN